MQTSCSMPITEEPSNTRRAERGSKRYLRDLTSSVSLGSRSGILANCNTTPRVPSSALHARGRGGDFLVVRTAGRRRPRSRRTTLGHPCSLLRDGQATGPLVMDAVIAAIALEHGATVCTTDRDFSRFPGVKWTNPLGGEWPDVGWVDPGLVPGETHHATSGTRARKVMRAGLCSRLKGSRSAAKPPCRSLARNPLRCSWKCRASHAAADKAIRRCE